MAYKQNPGRRKQLVDDCHGLVLLLRCQVNHQVAKKHRIIGALAYGETGHHHIATGKGHTAPDFLAKYIAFVRQMEIPLTEAHVPAAK